MTIYTQAATGACAAFLPWLPLAAALWATFVYGVGLGFLLNRTNPPKGRTIPSFFTADSRKEAF